MKSAFYILLFVTGLTGFFSGSAFSALKSDIIKEAEQSAQTQRILHMTLKQLAEVSITDSTL